MNYTLLNLPPLLVSNESSWKPSFNPSEISDPAVSITALYVCDFRNGYETVQMIYESSSGSSKLERFWGDRISVRL